MKRSIPASATTDLTALSARFALAKASLAVEAPDALNAMAALASEALAAGQPTLAACAASVVVLVEHLTAARYRHAADMLSILAYVGPAAAFGPEGLIAWAGAAVAHDYGVLPAWPAADPALLLERAQRAPADVALMLACALGELCERNGDDAGFATLQAQMAGVQACGDAAPFWRGHWALVSAWHLMSFAKSQEAMALLAHARALALEHGLRELGATANLQWARLTAWEGDAAQVLAMADRAAAVGDPLRTPLWFADRADVHCRLALRAQDFHAAVGHGRQAVGYLQAGHVWPGYQVTYRLNEGYALLGTGAFADAIACLDAARERPHPPYLTARLQCLSLLATLIAADRVGPWLATHQTALAKAIGLLRELEWPNVLPSLPGHVARLFVRALETGVELEWVQAAIRTRKLPAPPLAPASWPWAARVRALGGFEVSAEGGGVHQGHKAASKPLELLRLLAAHGHEAVRVDLVSQSLWPGDGREGRQKAFDITVARLRRLLHCDAAVLIRDHRVRLNGGLIWSDVQALGDHLVRGEAAPAGSAQAAAALDAALLLYRGACLADSAQPWARAAALAWRERLAAALLRELRCSDSGTLQGREWALRANAADPLLGALLNAAEQNAGAGNGGFGVGGALAA
jgi:DNA-binding SARP family transcriptional activator